MKSYELCILMWTLMALQSCIQVIDLDTGPSSADLVIYGEINNSIAHDQGIRISKTVSNFARPAPVDDATVTVEDEVGLITRYQYDADKENYIPEFPFNGVPGMAYRLSVTTEGKTFVSTFQRMPEEMGSDSVYVQFSRVPSDNSLEGLWSAVVYTDTELPTSSEALFLKRDILLYYIQREIALPLDNFTAYSPGNCWIAEPYQGPDVLLFDGSKITATSLQRQRLSTLLLDNTFIALRGVAIIQHSFSREAHTYWAQVQAVANRTGSLFEVPPAPIVGNIREIATGESVLGFFEVAKVDTMGVEFTEDDLPVYLGFNRALVECDNVTLRQMRSVPFNCLPCLTSIGLHEACYNCQVIPNSSRSKPRFLH